MRYGAISLAKVRSHRECTRKYVDNEEGGIFHVYKSMPQRIMHSTKTRF